MFYSKKSLSLWERDFLILIVYSVYSEVLHSENIKLINLSKNVLYYFITLLSGKIECGKM